MTMRLFVNGLKQDVPEGLTVTQLLEAEGEPADHVVVEINGVYLPVRQYPSRVLQEGDRLEIILPAFGG
jgi:thiamine biosynthesis protein ThiS